MADIEASKAHFVRYFLSHYTSVHTPESQPTEIARQQGSSESSDEEDDVFDDYAETSGRPASSPEAELEELFSLRAQPTKGPNRCPDAIRWWAGRRGQFNLLAKMARDILSIPGELCSIHLHTRISALTLLRLRLCCISRTHLQRRSRHHLAAPFQPDCRYHTQLDDSQAFSPTRTRLGNVGRGLQSIS
jgi:hypothetical protein